MTDDLDTDATGIEAKPAKPEKPAKRIRPPIKSLSEIGEAPMNQREGAHHIIGCSEGKFSRMVRKGEWKPKRTDTSSNHKPKYEQSVLRELRRGIDIGEISAGDEQSDVSEQSDAPVATGSMTTDPMPQGVELNRIRTANVYDLPPEQRAAYTPDANGILPDGRIASFIIGPDGKLSPPGYIYLANGQLVHEIDWIMKRSGYDEKDLYNPWV